MDSPDWIVGLEARVAECLPKDGEGLSEFELLRLLRSKDWLLGFPPSENPQLELFQTHFLLFHLLYRLQLRAWESGTGHLEISPLCIRMLPYQSGMDGLALEDPLRNYYLDLNHLADTGVEDVEAMLAGFWQRYLAGEGRQEALEVLGLEEPINRKAIEKRYRELVAKHHPDRGGDTQQQAEINKAVEILRQYYPQN